MNCAAPVWFTEIRHHVIKPALPFGHAPPPELGHLLRAILADGCSVGKLFQEKLRQGSVTGAHVQNLHRRVPGKRNRISNHLELWSSLLLVAVLALCPI